MSSTTIASTCWACAEALPRGAAKCAACGELQRAETSTCWACAEERPRGAMTCPRCGESPWAPSSGAPSLGYLFAVPFLFAVLGHQLGIGVLFGGLLGFGGWAVGVVVAARRSS
jgi:hypothetical protein